MELIFLQKQILNILLLIMSEPVALFTFNSLIKVSVSSGEHSISINKLWHFCSKPGSCVLLPSNVDIETRYLLRITVYVWSVLAGWGWIV